MIQTPIRTLTVQEAIETRRSTRKFVQEPMHDLREILRLTSLAPSANKVQPGRLKRVAKV